MPTRRDQSSLDEWNPTIKQVVENISSVMIGKQDVIRLVLVGLLAGGHCLIEDVPGVGKTMLVRAAAKTLGCDFRRIQFTPDMLPSDVTGVSIYNQHTQAFEFRSGPIFGQVVLADEINRTSPKTQSALLEALEEQSVTVDGTTYRLESPFFVLATENPIEFEGTFPLPEAQLDRFLMKFSVGYPSVEHEMDILTMQRQIHPVETLAAKATPADILEWRKQVREVHMDGGLRRYLVEMVQATRMHPHVYLGASPRGSVALFRAAQAYAFLAGRSYVIPDDIRYLAPYVLEHRIILSADARLSGVNANTVLQQIADKLHIPVMQGTSRV